MVSRSNDMTVPSWCRVWLLALGLICPSVLLAKEPPANSAPAAVPQPAAVPADALAEPGELLFSDHFDRDDLGEWKVVIPGFHVSDGVLIGRQERDDHGAVGRVYRPMHNVVVEFKFRLHGSTTFNAVFDDKNHKGSHAGHICRVAFAPRVIRVGDDREGVMRNDIYELRQDPARKQSAEPLLVGRSASFPFQWEQDRVYLVRLEVAGDQLRVLVDGRPVAYLQSPGIAHETKTSFHFTVNGPGVLFDDVHIWNVR